MNAHRMPAVVLLALASLAGCAAPEPAPETSVRPGVNERFKKKLDVDTWVRRFEGDSREIYKHRARIVESLGLRPGLVVADIGAGTGFFSMLFAEAVGPGGRVYAVDISPDFIRHIASRAKEEGRTNITTIRCAEDSVDLPRASVDVAFICDTYHHFEYPRSTMRSLYDAMKPGGTVVIVDFLHSPDSIAHLSADRRDWIRDHVRAGRDQTIREVVGMGFEHIPAPPTPYLEENYLIRFRKPA